VRERFHRDLSVIFMRCLSSIERNIVLPEVLKTI